MNSCYSCQSQKVRQLLDLGMQPVSNRFLKDPTETEEVYVMALDQCEACGLVQMSNPIAADKLLPPYDWVTYSEPEDHLDHLVDVIVDLPGITQESRFGGISFKDESTLRRLKERGFENTRVLDLEDDLNIKNAGAGVETIQKQLTPDAARHIVKKRGKVDVVIVRHIIEHTHDTKAFNDALKELIHPDGYIVFEAPDCSRALESSDCTTIWEEHSMYFTPVTFKDFFQHYGLSLCRYESHPYPFENSLIGIVQLGGEAVNSSLTDDVLTAELNRAGNFAKNLSKQSERFKVILSEYQRDYGNIALFGAGHLACTFVNLLGLKDMIAFFVDDNPHKRGLFMPGSKLPIYGSSSLIEKDIALCLLSLNPLSEQKVIQANQEFTDRGGVFFSIFPNSKIALHHQEILKERGEHADQRV